ncbi:NADPH:adrenodoxin oxidoreductase, mitochondrial-like [Aplysia californica]|uniref:NADPH:adrenodoxin oxidoreductase, mitochondrial-like n=1 Tax=Aplysia californica TaxID=6500 RepID=A0ABM1AFJ7_APLCA|nr:NADPH:adrenodoxin oxidoreductase, mitochondrial-like [Aplysia californica]
MQLCAFFLVCQKTDISEHALDCLRKSKVKRVHLVGRRGPLQVAFTIKELREMVKLPGTRPVISPLDVQGLDKIIKDLPRPRRRLTELIHKTGTAVRPGSEEVKEWTLHFCRSPQRILTSAGGDVAGIELVVNRLQGETLESQKAVATDEREILPCGLVGF